MDEETKQEIEELKKEQIVLSKIINAKGETVSFSMYEITSLLRMLDRITDETDHFKSMCVEVARMLNYLVVEAVRIDTKTTLNDAEDILDNVQDQLGFYFCPDCDGLGCQRCDYEGVVNA